MTDQRIINAIAEAMASIDGKLPQLRVCRKYPEVEEVLGHADGYASEAEALIERAELRGVRFSFADQPGEPPCSQPPRSEG